MKYYDVFDMCLYDEALIINRLFFLLFGYVVESSEIIFYEVMMVHGVHIIIRDTGKA